METWFKQHKKKYCMLWIVVHNFLGMSLIVVASKNILINPQLSIWSLFCCFGICIPVAWYYTKEYNKCVDQALSKMIH